MLRDREDWEATIAGDGAVLEAIALVEGLGDPSEFSARVAQ